MEETRYPKVGVAVFIEKDGKYIFMKRKGSHGNGTWAIPGGKLDWFEDFEECAKREVLEETGVEIEGVEFVHATNNHFKDEDQHFITIVMKARWKSGEPQIVEPDKCTDMGWYTIDEIKQKKMFLPLESFFEEMDQDTEGKIKL